MRWTFLVPELPVRNVAAAQEWYREALGLGTNWIWEDRFGSVGEDCVELFLVSAPDRGPVTCFLFVDDVDAVYERCREKEVEIVGELEAKPWNVREFSLRDPDGNVLRIGTAVETEQDRVPAELSVPGGTA